MFFIQMQLRNMTDHYNELNDVHTDLLEIATETLDKKLQNFTTQIVTYNEERSLRRKGLNILIVWIRWNQFEQG